MPKDLLGGRRCWSRVLAAPTVLALIGIGAVVPPAVAGPGKPAFPRGVTGAVSVSAMGGVVDRSAVSLGRVAPTGAVGQSVRFGEPGPPQSYVVPAGVRAVRVVARGAGGGGGRAGAGGDGARAESIVAVLPGEVLRVDVGAGGAPGRGATGGRGGSASAVTGRGVLVVAAGGGGGGGAGHGDAGRGADRGGAGRDAGAADAVVDPAELGSPPGHGGRGHARGGTAGHSYVHDGHDGLPAGTVRRLGTGAAGDPSGRGGPGGHGPQSGGAGEVVISPVDRRPRLDRPAIWRVTPDSGPSSGDAEVVIRGRGLHRAESARFGSVPGLGLVVVSDREIRVLAPQHRAGRVNVTVTAAGSTAVARDAYRFR